jgi:hypothetical protein
MLLLVKINNSTTTEEYFESNESRVIIKEDKFFPI